MSKLSQSSSAPNLAARKTSTVPELPRVITPPPSVGARLHASPSAPRLHAANDILVPPLRQGAKKDPWLTSMSLNRPSRNTGDQSRGFGDDDDFGEQPSLTAAELAALKGAAKTALTSPPARPRRKSTGGFDPAPVEAAQVRPRRRSIGSDPRGLPEASGPTVAVAAGTPVRAGSLSGPPQLVDEALANKFYKKGLVSAEQMPVLESMEMTSIIVPQGRQQIEIQVRSLCHGPKDAPFSERLRSKDVVLVLDDFSRAPSPWMAFVQPALHLHKQGFNIVWVDIPSFEMDRVKYMKYGPELILDFIRKLQLAKPHVLARGVGGAIFMQALCKESDLFANTNIVHNLHFPRDAGVIFEEDMFQKVISWDERQVWFSFHGQDPSTASDAGTKHVHDQIMGCQERLKPQTKFVGKNGPTFDKLLFTPSLLMQCHVKEAAVTKQLVLSLSGDLLSSMERFFSNFPDARQESLQGGLVVQPKTVVPKKTGLVENVATGPTAASEEGLDQIMAHIERKRERILKHPKSRKIYNEDCDKMRAMYQSFGDAEDFDLGKKPLVVIRNVKPAPAALGSPAPQSPGISEQSTCEPESPADPASPSFAPPNLDLDKSAANSRALDLLHSKDKKMMRAASASSLSSKMLLPRKLVDCLFSWNSSKKSAKVHCSSS